MKLPNLIFCVENKAGVPLPNSKEFDGTGVDKCNLIMQFMFVRFYHIFCSDCPTDHL